MITERFAAFIAKHPKVILILATLLLIPGVFGYISTFVNYDLMSYLPENIESVQGERILDETFKAASSSFLVIENMEPKDIVSIKERIAQIEGVSSVTWVDDILGINVPASMLPDEITDIFYSERGDATLIMIQFSQSSASEQTMSAVKEIKALLNEKCLLSGMSAILEDTKELAESEAPLYIAVAVALAVAALMFTMDSWLIAFVLVVALGYAVIYNMGTNLFLSNGISFITQSVAAILQLGVTMDYSVFLMDRYNEELVRASGDTTKAMTRAVSATLHSLAGSSLTTVFGFLALCFMSFSLGMDIGIVMAKGVLLGVLTVVVVLPAFLLLLDKPIHRLRHRRFIPSFSRLNGFLLKHRRAFSVAFALLLVPAFVAKSGVELSYDIVDTMPKQLESVQALETLGSDFNMATSHFVIISDAIPSGEVSQMVEEFEAVQGISNVISLNSYVGSAVSESILPDDIKEICMRGGYQLMMLNSVYTSSSGEQNAQLDTLNKILKRYDPNGYLTGLGALSKDLVEVTDRDFKLTSVISIAAIFILIAIFFKSISIPIILVLAIELAIFVNQAIALITGAEVSFVTPTVISCIQLGATVDYAILLTMRYREELRSGKDRVSAMKAAADTSCRSIFQSALVFFCATFGVYLVCNIEMVGSICAMLARGAIISALVIMLFLTPLLVVLEGFINKTTLGWRAAGRAEKTRGTKV